METILKINHLNKTYGSQQVLTAINMEIKKGAIYGFIGRNGAGKSTLMRIITGLAAADDGQLELFGEADQLNNERHRLGVIIENPTLHKGLTAFDNLEIQRRILGGKVSKERIPVVLEKVGLGNVGKKKVRAFSLGMKQRLALAMALLNKPDFLILDEPINGLDPMGVIEIRNTIKELAKSGVTVMISSHILAELHLLATDFGFIEGGRLIKQLTALELDAECQHYIDLRTSDDARAYGVLNKQFGQVVKKASEHLVVSDVAIPTDAIIAVLTEAGIGVKGISQVDQDLESYFMNLIGEAGGRKHV
ncbi:MAG: ATP-binding cassette domain-containing protein [Turicibacter sp.]|nr:ATP-binding cassette domain-containing protein [Turicibacter sp.]